jgi:glutamate-1-semialdehyde 2,1-aminomutase
MRKQSNNDQSSYPSHASADSISIEGQRAADVIPGGCHTYSKADHQFVAGTPRIVRGNGAWVWGDDGGKYLSWATGGLSVSLGHAYPSVLTAVSEQLALGGNFERPSVFEHAAANFFIENVSSSDMVKFSKTGSMTTTAAVKLARAFTRREKVAICRDHPYFGYDDWFIATTPFNSGVPTYSKSLALEFRFNSVESLHALVPEVNNIACLILEPIKFHEPTEAFISALHSFCVEHHIVLILDETNTGCKWHIGGAQKVYGYRPTLTVWGKSIANGFSVAALSGPREIMNLGALNSPEHAVHLLSTTHGSETHSLAAMVATVTELRDKEIIPSNLRRANQLSGWIEDEIRLLGLEDEVKILGHKALMRINTPRGLEYRTLLLQELLNNGVLFKGLLYTTWSHQQDELEYTVEAFRKALRVFSDALELGIDRFLKAPIIRPVFELTHTQKGE